jgi:hypothetical protein
MSDPRDLPRYTPFDADAADSDQLILGGERSIAYLGLALTRAEFSSYLDALSFDSPPLWPVLHHTAIPAASWAPYGDPARFWDAGEAGLSAARIKAKRLAQLANIFDYYQNTLGWSAGPQLWVDDRYIYVGTPLTQEGIHAGGGNYTTVAGRRRYSVGVEVIGYYEQRAWPELVLANVAHAVVTLQRKLGTFQLLSGKGPGFISEHRHYSKPSCPGGAVKPAAYMPRFLQARAALAPAVSPVEYLTVGLSADSPIIGQPFAPDDQVIAAFARICAEKGSPYARENPNPITTIIGPRYAELCRQTGVRLLVVLAQCAHETGWLTAALSQRRDKDGRDLRNPAGIGVSEGKEHATPFYRNGTVWDADVQGYRPATQFKDWKRESCLAQVGRLLAYATKREQRTVEQQIVVNGALAFRGLPDKCHGSAETLRELGSGPNTVDDCGWAGAGDTGGLGYGANLAAAGNAILAELRRV